MYFMKFNGKAKKIFALAAALCLSCGMLVAGCGGNPTTPPDDGSGNQPGGEKTVTKIEVTTQPDKLEFYVGDTFTAEGGELTVTYSDGSTEKVSMTDKDVTFAGTDMVINNAEKDEDEKTITVRYGGKTTRYEVTVSYQMLDVTFDYNYIPDGATEEKTEVVSVRKDSPVAEPKVEERDSYNFEAWYSDEQLTAAYDFEKPVTAEMTLYARWLEDATYYYVTFDNNYEECPDGTRLQVKEGDKAVAPTTNPERKGYDFVGWYTDSDGTTAFNFAETTITEATTVYAKWERDFTDVPDGVNEYVFEAENTNLDGKTGPGLSGTASAGGMIQTVKGFNASGDMFVGYQYEIGCSITFQFISDRTINDAKIVLSLSAEYGDFTMNYTDNQIEVNGQYLEYSDIAFVDVPNPGTTEMDTSKLYALPFEDFVIAENVTLYEGLNYVTIMTNNSNALEGTTFKATAPLVDCLKVTTGAVLDWCRRLGLPKNYV